MLDKNISNELKVLALEMINNAGSGHSGSVLSCGDALYTLYTRHLLTDGTKNINRDRFVLSNGHACAVQYAILAGMGVIDYNDIFTFRKYGANLAGHPEIHIPGVDANTGPLGQGVANAVGMAIAGTIMNARFGVDCYTYCMVGDGCLQEGVGLESLSIAGLYKLNKFILLYDKNNVTLDGKLNNSSVDDFSLKFKSMNFNVIECDGHDIEKIDKAIIKAKKCKDKPSVIILNTIIGKDTNLAGSYLSHGKVYSEEDIQALKNKYKINNEKLQISSEAKEFLNSKRLEILRKFNEKVDVFNENLSKNKEKFKKYNNFIKNNFKFKSTINKNKISTRNANNFVLSEINKTKENIVVLSADLSSSTKVKINEGGSYSSTNRLGKNIAVGVREHAMGAIANGIALFGGLQVITSTFLTFSNYMIQPIRMAAIMNLPVMFAFSHSSSCDAADGVTHVPVEQLDQLRLIPNVNVVRPCDMQECLEAYKIWQIENKPMCLCVSKTSTPFVEKTVCELDKGAYYITDNKAKINLLASGTEVSLALNVKELLKQKNIDINIVSVPSLELFDQQPAAYKNKFLKKENFAIEMSLAFKYLKYLEQGHIFNVPELGISGDTLSINKHFNFTADAVANKILKALKK